MDDGREMFNSEQVEHEIVVMFSDDDNQDEDIEQEARRAATQRRQHRPPTEQEMEEHRRTQLPYRSSLTQSESLRDSTIVSVCGTSLHQNQQQRLFLKACAVLTRCLFLRDHSEFHNSEEYVVPTVVSVLTRI